MARPNGPVAAADCKHSASAANKHAGSLKPVMLVLKDAAIIAIAAGSGDVDLAAGSSLPLYYSISLCAGLCLVAWPKEAGHGSAAPPGGRGEAASGARLLLQASNRSGRGDSAVGFGSLPLSMHARAVAITLLRDGCYMYTMVATRCESPRTLCNNVRVSLSSSSRARASLLRLVGLARLPKPPLPPHNDGLNPHDDGPGRETNELTECLASCAAITCCI